MKRLNWQLQTPEGDKLASNNDTPRATKLVVSLGNDVTIVVELFERDALGPLNTPHLQVRSTNDYLAVVPVASNCVALVKAPK